MILLTCLFALFSVVSGRPTKQKAFQNSISPLNLDLLQTSIAELGTFLNNGSLTGVHLVQQYFGQCSSATFSQLTIDTANIERNNVDGLGLRAVLRVAPKHSGWW